jgi:hypothetical protein
MVGTNDQGLFDGESASAWEEMRVVYPIEAHSGAFSLTVESAGEESRES